LISFVGSNIILQLMDLLFGFLEPNRPHSALLAGYFGKVSFLLIRSIYKGQQILGSARCVLTWLCLI